MDINGDYNHRKVKKLQPIFYETIGSGARKNAQRHRQLSLSIQLAT
jgi:hypothetical protein